MLGILGVRAEFWDLDPLQIYLSKTLAILYRSYFSREGVFWLRKLDTRETLGRSSEDNGLPVITSFLC